MRAPSLRTFTLRRFRDRRDMSSQTDTGRSWAQDVVRIRHPVDAAQCETIADRLRATRSKAVLRAPRPRLSSPVVFEPSFVRRG